MSVVPTWIGFRLRDVGRQLGGDVGEGGADAGGERLHGNSCSKSDEGYDQGVLDQVLTLFLHQALDCCAKLRDGDVHVCSPCGLNVSRLVAGLALHVASVMPNSFREDLLYKSTTCAI